MESTGWVAQTVGGEQFLRAVADGSQRMLLVADFDGTLARIVPSPMDARMVPRSGEALAQLAVEGVQIAVVSGRPVKTLLELTGGTKQPGLANAIIFGHYGAERINMTSGDIFLPEPPVGIDAARSRLQEIAEQYPGARIEDKGLAVAIHFRQADHAEVAFLATQDAVEKIAEDTGLTLEPGRLVWELRGPSVTKGDALELLVQEVNPTAVVFAGDDLGDIAAFRALQRLGDSRTELRTCAVVSGSPEVPELRDYADVLCSGPDGFAAWLEDLAAALSGEESR